MKSATLVTALTGLTTAMAVVAPIVIFGFVYVLKVQPERAAARDAQHQLAAVEAELHRRRMPVAPKLVVSQASAVDEFNARIGEAARVREVVDALSRVLDSPAVGGVSNLAIETGAPVEGAEDPMLQLFSREVAYTPVMVTFHARYEQIGRFFWNLRALPAIVDVHSIELTPGGASRQGLMRAKVSLHVFHRAGAAVPATLQPKMVDVTTPPQWKRDPFAVTASPAVRRVAAHSQAPPVVSSILVSNGRRLARVDGRIVRPGDRLASGVVRSIEPDAIVIADASGITRRVEIARPALRITRH
jgi:Tfp pilus assembly protein PilO